MKMSLIGDDANWIIDDMTKDYQLYSRHQFLGINKNPDVALCVSLFNFPSIVEKIPSSCLKFFIIHHIDEEKISEYNFDKFNKANGGAIVFTNRTRDVAIKYITVPINILPYWINSKRMKNTNYDFVQKMRKTLSPNGEVLIGSFQKDGNGVIGDSPKMSKGPDILVDLLTKLSPLMKLKVILAGYARQYVISNLEKHSIPYVYYHRYDDINSLYDCLDWYFVTSRVEGGPQSVLEASYRKIKILSTDVGVVPEILHPDCICKNVEDFMDRVKQGVDRTQYNFDMVSKNHLPSNVIPKWDDFFESQISK